MNKFQNQENLKLSRGACIVVSDDCSNSYSKLADAAAKQLKKHLKISTCVISPCSIDYDFKYVESVAICEINQIENFRSVKSCTNSSTQKWTNIGRTSVYEYSPFDSTLLVDADYFVFSDSLLKVLDSSQEFLIYTHATDLIDTTKFHNENYLSNLRLNQNSWATVIKFTKSDLCKNIFGLAKYIEQNYEYYAKFFGFPRLPIRNDRIFAIAKLIVSGYTQEPGIPWSLIHISENVKLHSIHSDGFVYGYEFEGTKRVCKQSFDIDMHFLDKNIAQAMASYLLESQ